MKLLKIIQRFSLLTAAILFYYQAEAQEINVTGKVVDQSSNPVSNVNVSLDAAQISTVTDVSGNFSLIRSATGIEDLIRDELPGCYFDGRRLFISCTGQNVSISIFDLSGRLITHVLNQKKLTGTYSICPAAYISSGHSSIYILHISMDSYQMNFKLIDYNDIFYSKGLEEISKTILSDQSLYSKKSLNALDTLIFVHDLYLTKKIPIPDYITDVGTVQLEDKAVVIPAPTSLIANAVSSSQINLIWSDNSGNEEGFKIERSPDGSSGWAQIATVGVNTTSYQNTGLSPSTTYYYRIYAYNAEGNSSYSNTANATTNEVSPNAPSGLSATAASSTQINLSWTDNSSNESGFKIERSPDGSSGWTQIAEVGANTTSYQNTGLSPSTTYYYRVYAYNAAGNSSYSNTANATTPALDYEFAGGSLEDLEAVSPSLIFGTLTINGKLEIPSSESSVTFTVANMDINAMIDVLYPTCRPYYDAPNITINATGNVWIDAPISLNGKWGVAIASGATCNSCTGTDGGDFTVNANNIYVNSYIHTWGGNGSNEDLGSGIKCGCNAGDGGNITLNATGLLDINADGSNFNLEGGEGGSSVNCGGGGADGTDGILDFEGATIEVEEINLGSTEYNMYDYNAQLLDYEKMTLTGYCKFQEEYDHRNKYGTWYVDYGGGIIDWIEDIYVLYTAGGRIKLNLTASNPSADLDIFLTNTSGTILAYSNGATSTESIDIVLLNGGYYWVWVSYSDDGQNYSTNYTLKFNY